MYESPSSTITINYNITGLNCIMQHYCYQYVAKRDTCLCKEEHIRILLHRPSYVTENTNCIMFSNKKISSRGHQNTKLLKHCNLPYPFLNK